MPTRYKKATTEMLKAMSDAAHAQGFNASLTAEAFADIDPAGTHIGEFVLVHEHAKARPTIPHLRIRWLIKPNGRPGPCTGLIDVLPEVWESLPDPGD